MQRDNAVLLERIGVDQLGQLRGQHARVAVLAVAQQRAEAVLLCLRILQALEACMPSKQGQG